jgi:hypothetical protein
MNPWGNIWTWYNDDTSVEIPLDNTTVVDEEINLPSDFDIFSWWNPADWGGNYDLNIDQYNQRKSLENESQTKIYIYIASGLLALFLLKK